MGRKHYCALCDWHGDSDEALKGVNPFEVKNKVWGCPNCKEINTLYLACDEPGCWQGATSGTPTKDGYRSTCYKHVPERENP